MSAPHCRRIERGRAGSRRVVRAYRCRVEGIEEPDDECASCTDCEMLFDGV